MPQRFAGIIEPTCAPLILSTIRMRDAPLRENSCAFEDVHSLCGQNQLAGFFPTSHEREKHFKLDISSLGIDGALKSQKYLTQKPCSRIV